MIDILRALGLTDWPSFCWGAGAMFVLVVVALGICTWACNNAPTMEDYDDRRAA